jgi:hypothetical protein
VAGHSLLAAHAACRRPALRLSDVTERSALARGELYGDLLHGAGVEYEIAIGARTGRGDAVVAALGRTEREFSERGRDVLDIASPRLEGALRTTHARPPLVSERDGRRVIVWRLAGDPQALLLEETVASFGPEALDRLGLTARETKVLRAAAAVDDEAELAWELFLSASGLRNSRPGATRTRPPTR